MKEIATDFLNKRGGIKRDNPATLALLHFAELTTLRGQRDLSYVELDKHRLFYGNRRRRGRIKIEDAVQERKTKIRSLKYAIKSSRLTDDGYKEAEIEVKKEFMPLFVVKELSYNEIEFQAKRGVELGKSLTNFILDELGVSSIKRDLYGLPVRFDL